MIKFEDIHKKYKNADYEVLDGLNLEISDGEFIHLKGKSGKSTVLHFIYLMDRPTSGKVFYGEKELNKLKFNFQRARIRRKIGYVDQDLWLLDDRTVYENIKISTDLLKVKSKERKERVDEILAYFDLENIKKQKIGQLSYQEKILVELSRELVKKPELLILDEVFETEATFNNPNRRRTGRPDGTMFGYNALGYFTYDDFNPDGSLKAGDRKSVV